MSDAKLMRKQLRNVVQEQLSEVMSSELVVGLSKELDARINARLTALEAHVKQALNNIDARSKDVQDLILRQVLTARSQETAAATTPVEETNAQK